MKQGSDFSKELASILQERYAFFLNQLIKCKLINDLEGFYFIYTGEQIELIKQRITQI